ncbi:5'-3' exonuclease [Lacicoccus qingdaonensis]|uniref:5'-3' exonuclease n=1 Tax=Lacicoccus qingdaonensis TaxID=576118 RepID=A0A1G9CI14_9BACL|nr:5'-3' exonuclease [Salinicoccus qingdaonensis]SDK51268.1 5'-3' exonuclease [Salinicoccus qingdaonensis]
MKDKTLVIDGMALLFRHFYATSFRNQFMVNNKNIPTNGIQGLIRHTMKLVELTRPENMVITWDMGKDTIRNEWFKDYKANRTAPPDEMIPQFDYVKEIIHDMGFYQLGIHGYEADDIIGTLSVNYDDLIIVSGDRDLLQLLGKNNDIWLTKKGVTEYHYYNEQNFMDEYDITPEQFVDVKALMGDSGDGYYGVKGIGEKTALKLIREYKNVENIIENIDSLSKGLQTKILNDMSSLQMSHKLAKIITDVEFSHDEYMEHRKLIIDTEKIDQTLASHDLRITQKYLHNLNI